MNMTISAVVAVTGVLIGAALVSDHRAQVGTSDAEAVTPMTANLTRRGIRPEDPSPKDLVAAPTTNSDRRGERSGWSTTQKPTATKAQLPRRGTRDRDRG